MQITCFSEKEIFNFIALIFFGYLFSIKRNYIGTGFLMILWNFVGVVLHELSHYLVALLLNGKPKLPNLLPKRQKVYINGIQHYLWTLGYVEVRNPNSFNSFFIGLAPILVLVPIAFYVYLYFFEWFEYNTQNLFLFYLSLYILLYNAMPSTQDIKVAYKGYLGFLIFTLTAISLYIFFSYREL